MVRRARRCTFRPDRLPLLFGVLVGLGGLDLVACAPPPRPPNLILILIDTLRPDHLGAYGYARPTSPHIDRLAASGTLFTRALAPSSWTKPSVASLFTSRYPSEHGAVSFRRHLFKNLPTLAEALRDAGYETVGVSGNFVHVSETTGLARGFDHWLNFSKRTQSKQDSIFNISDKKDRPVYLRAPSAQEINEEVLKRVSAAPAAREPGGEKPLFLYVHFMEPHSSYSPPLKIRKRFITDPNYRDGQNASSEALTTLAGGKRQASERERQWLTDLYDAEIATVDAAVAELLDGVAKLGYAENTVTVLVSDHGEALGERGSYFHGLELHAETLRVPLIFFDSRAPTRGVRRDDPVDLLDVAPTLLALAGAPIVPGMRGRDLFAEQTDALPRRDLVAELHPDPPFEEKISPRLQRLSLQRWPWKAIALRDDRPMLVYRIDRDPEERDAVATSDGVPKALTEAVDRLVVEFDRLDAARPTAHPLSEQTREGLRALGYAE